MTWYVLRHAATLPFALLVLIMLTNGMFLGVTRVEVIGARVR